MPRNDKKAHAVAARVYDALAALSGPKWRVSRLSGSRDGWATAASALYQTARGELVVDGRSVDFQVSVRGATAPLVTFTLGSELPIERLVAATAACAEVDAAAARAAKNR